MADCGTLIYFRIKVIEQLQKEFIKPLKAAPRRIQSKRLRQKRRYAGKNAKRRPKKAVKSTKAPFPRHK
jgi:hypothetical protein